MKKTTGAVVLCLIFSMSAGFHTAANAQVQKLTIHFFYGRECPHCKTLEPEIRTLARSDPRLELRTYEVWYNKENRALFMRMARERGEKARGVPTVIIGNDVYLGADIGRVKALVIKNFKK